MRWASLEVIERSSVHHHQRLCLSEVCRVPQFEPSSVLPALRTVIIIIARTTKNRIMKWHARPCSLSDNICPCHPATSTPHHTFPLLHTVVHHAYWRTTELPLPTLCALHLDLFIAPCNDRPMQLLALTQLGRPLKPAKATAHIRSAWLLWSALVSVSSPHLARFTGSVAWTSFFAIGELLFLSRRKDRLMSGEV